MRETEQLAYRLKEVILNGTWIANTNYKDQLESLDWNNATLKFESLHTISALAQHVHYYIKGILQVFKDGNLEIRDKYSFDFPPMESQKEWKAFLTEFWKDTEILADFITQMPDDQLRKYFVEEKYGSYQRNIDALIEHCYYHLGQIVLIKKILSHIP